MEIAQYLFHDRGQMDIVDILLGLTFVLAFFAIATLMKNKLRALIALLKSRAYLERRYQMAEQELIPHNDSHCERKPKDKYQTQQDEKSQSKAIRASGAECPDVLSTTLPECNSRADARNPKPLASGDCRIGIV